MDTYRVLLVNPPSPPGKVANREGAAGMGTLYDEGETFLYPPHTLATVAAVLRDAGHDVSVVDLVVHPDSPLPAADLVGVFVSFATFEDDLQFLIGLDPRRAPVVAFGPAMRFLGQQVLARVPEGVALIGDAEALFPAAMEQVVRAGVRGMVGAHELGASGCDAEGFLQDLDRLPFPAWDLLPYDRYPLLTILSSRGCPDQCSYCPYAAAQGHRWRVRSVDHVLDELLWLQQRFQPQRVVFRDPAFGYDRQRVVSLCEGMLRRGVHLKWECESRPEHFDDELLHLIKAAGCTWIKLGVETTDAQLLHRLKRISSPTEADAYLRHIKNVTDTCRRIGLQCRLFAMTGLPGQDARMAEETAGFLSRVAPLAMNVKDFEPYPGIAAGISAVADADAQRAVLHRAQAEITRASARIPLARRIKRRLRRLFGDRA